MKTPRARIPVFLISAPLLASSGPSRAADEAARLCQSSVEFGPKVVAVCRVPAATVTRVYRFEAVFEGGHDDTRAALVPRRAEAPYPCEPGSKPELDGEYGTVRVTCRVQVVASDKPTQFEFDVIWYHADYTHVEFHAE